MHGSSDDILERIRTREVTGVFHSRKALAAAIQDLLVAGIDRADIDISASLDELERRLNYQSIPSADLADLPITARQPFTGDDDVMCLPRGLSSAASPVASAQLPWRFILSRET
jgi:hypothetical protein